MSSIVADVHICYFSSVRAGDIVNGYDRVLRDTIEGSEPEINNEVGEI